MTTTDLELLASPGDSKLTKTARVFAIVRDALIIFFLLLTLVFGLKFVSAYRSVTADLPAANPPAPAATYNGTVCLDPDTGGFTTNC